MMREQESSSAESKQEAGAGRSKSPNPTPSRGRNLINLQRSAGNRAVAAMMKPGRSAPTVIQRDLDAELKNRWQTTDVPYDKIAIGIKQLVDSPNAGTSPGPTGAGSQIGAKTGTELSGKVVPTVTTAPDPAAAKKAFMDYKASLKDPKKKEEQLWKDRLEKAQGEDKKAEDKAANLEIIKKHGYELKGNESEDDLADLADVFKTQDTETRTKKKTQMKDRMESDQAAKQLIAAVAAGKKAGGTEKGAALTQLLGKRKL
jgi:hypothetical protein